MFVKKFQICPCPFHVFEKKIKKMNETRKKTFLPVLYF